MWNRCSARRAVSRSGRRHRRQQLEAGGGELGPEPDRGQRPRGPVQEERLGLLGRQPGQVRPVATEQGVAAAGAPLADDRDTGGAEVDQVAVDRPLRDLQLGGELGGRQPPARLEQEQEAHQPGSPHPFLLSRSRT
jgi:hypothetical protein